MKNLLFISAIACAALLIACKEQEAQPQVEPPIVQSPTNVSDTANNSDPMYRAADSLLKQAEGKGNN